MSQASSQASRFLVIVTSPDSVSQAIEYALLEARDLQAEFEEPVVVDIRVVTREESIDSGTKDQIQRALSTFDSTAELRTRFEILTLTGDTSESRTESLLSQITDQHLSRLIVPADTDLSVARLRERFGTTTLELAPIGTPRHRRRLLHPGGLRRLGTIFGLTYLFYLAIGGFVGGLDLLTGAISAGVVALALSHVAFSREPTLKRTGGRLARMVVFLPVLVWEIVKANFVIASLILHPRLPIDPAVEVIETDTRDGLERMVLANSITLTPGTVTIDVHDREFTIHSLTAAAREDLHAGRLQRLVSWVFHGAGHDGQHGDGSDGP